MTWVRAPGSTASSPPEKGQDFEEAFRVLRPGGWLAVSDVVRTAPFPDDVRSNPESLAACVAGASSVDALETILADAGFEDVSIKSRDESDEFIREWDDDRDLSDYLVSAAIEGLKPIEGAGN